jgi:hypothetical protein
LKAEALTLLLVFFHNFVYNAVTSKEEGNTMSEYVAYCVKCKAKRPMKDVQVVTNEKGRRLAKGVCPNCGTKMNLFLKSEK